MFRVSIVIIFVILQFHSYSQQPILTDFEYEAVEGCRGPFGAYNKKIDLPVIEIRNDTLIAEFYFSGLPNPINYGVIENIEDTILLSIRTQYNNYHHCRGGCFFKVKYKIKLFNKEHFILEKTFKSFGENINRQDSIVLCQHQVEIEKQIRKVTTQRISELREDLNFFRDSIENLGIPENADIDYFNSINEKKLRLQNESNEISKKFTYLEKVDSFEIIVTKFNFSMKWFCDKKRGRVEYVYHE